MPEGIRIVYLPPYTPELQPAETLWTHVDEPIVNKHFETLDELDAAIAAQCVALNADRDKSAARPASTVARARRPELIKRSSYHTRPEDASCQIRLIGSRRSPPPPSVAAPALLTSG